MGKVFGTNEGLIIDDEQDSEGELNISMAVMCSDSEATDTWVNKDHAIAIIEHLNKVFEL